MAVVGTSDYICHVISKGNFFFSSIAGRLRTYSDSRDGTQIIETNSTYPNGSKRRHSIAASDRLTCTVCDPIGRQEVCVSDYCVHLGDTAVFVFVNNGTLKETFQLSGCSPRYLQTSTVTESIIFVVCRPTDTGQPQYRDLSFSGQQFELTSKIVPDRNNYPLTPHNGVFSGGEDGTYFQQDFFLYIRNNEVFLEVVGGYEPPRQLNFQTGRCDTKDILHAMPPRDNKPQFLLSCTKSNVTKWFIVNVDTPDDLSLEVTEINHSSGGTPFASTTVIVFVNSNNLTVYEVANLQNYPATKTFSRPIKQIDFLSSNRLLVVVSGRNHSLIDIPVFVQTEGGQGVAELPSSVAYCPIGGTCLPHKLVNQDVLVSFIHNQSYYDAVFYNLTDPTQRLATLRRLINRPQVVFYDRLPSPPASNSPPTSLPTPSPIPSPPTSPPTPSPPPTISSTTTIDQVSSLTVPGPSPTSHTILSTSPVLPGASPSSPPPKSTPTDSSQELLNAGLTDWEAIGIAVSIFAITVVVLITVAILVVCFLRRTSHFSKYPSEHLPCLHRQSCTPVQEAPKSYHREPPLGTEDTIPSIVTMVTSSNEELNRVAITILLPQADSQPSSGYASQVPSRRPTPTPCDQETPPRDQETPPDGTSQHGDNTPTTGNAPHAQTVQSSQMVTGKTLLQTNQVE